MLAAMPLSAGQSLAHYEIMELIGRGGMGEVYRARDAKLGRDVAIKVLPEDLARDTERLERFEREARLLAQLNHPNIATLYGLEEHDGRQCLVMELVEGDNLAERLAGGPIPLSEAVSLFTRIAEGLEAAHRKGVIHRDLKPANIKITPDSKPKILDFGLAKAMAGEPGGAHDVSQSPTLTKGTALGAVMGTPSYMSPEQARGTEVGQPTDIWAYGCCLYEALTGKKAFPGETTTDILAAVVKSEPDWNLLEGHATDASGLRALLERCLRKDVARRYRDIGDVRISLEDILASPASGRGDSAPQPSSRMRMVVPSIAGGIVMGLLLGFSMLNEEPAEHVVGRFAIPLPPGDELVAEANLTGPNMALSPDGSTLVYVGQRAGVDQLFLRSMDSFETRPLDGTRGARQPFFSPDGNSVGFFASGRLQRMALSGGIATSLCDAVGTPVGASWAPTDDIYFSVLGPSGLRKVRATGGDCEEATTPAELGQIGHRWPRALVDSGAILYSAMESEETTHLMVESLATGETRRLVVGGFGGGAASAVGRHIIFSEGSSLQAIVFNAKTLEVAGDPVQVLDGVRRRQFAVAENGTLVYATSVDGEARRSLVRVSRNGVEEPLTTRQRGYVHPPRLSPDGTRLAITINDVGEPPEIWLYELARDTFTRFTVAGGRASVVPLWTPDGQRIVFASDRLDGIFQPFAKKVDSVDEARPLLESPSVPLFGPTSISPDGSLVYVGRFGTDTGRDIVAVGLEDGSFHVVLESSFNEHSPAVSPDGRWLAYVSDESGRDEVYVLALTESRIKRQISTEGGTEPRWSRDGEELFYREGDKFLVVAIPPSGDTQIVPGSPVVLFEASYLHHDVAAPRPMYDVFPDGQSFVFIRDSPGTALTLRVILNFDEELDRLVPVED